MFAHIDTLQTSIRHITTLVLPRRVDDMSPRQRGEGGTKELSRRFLVQFTSSHVIFKAYFAAMNPMKKWIAIF